MVNPVLRFKKQLRTSQFSFGDLFKFVGACAIFCGIWINISLWSALILFAIPATSFCVLSIGNRMQNERRGFWVSRIGGVVLAFWIAFLLVPGIVITILTVKQGAAGL